MLLIILQLLGTCSCFGMGVESGQQDAHTVKHIQNERSSASIAELAALAGGKEAQARQTQSAHHIQHPVNGKAAESAALVSDSLWQGCDSNLQAADLQPGLHVHYRPPGPAGRKHISASKLVLMQVVSNNCIGTTWVLEDGRGQ